MSSTTATPFAEIAEAGLTYQGRPLDATTDALGRIRETPATAAPAELHAGLEADGYVLLRGVLDRAAVLGAGHELLRRLGRLGYLDEAYPPEAGVSAPAVKRAFAPELARDHPGLDTILYAGPMMGIFRRLLGGAVRHFDYTWLRAKSPGTETATHPHYDIVYMGRGTQRLYTAWTPLVDIPVEMGGLMVLEQSHRLEEIKATYGTLDVDTYCTNTDEGEEIRTGKTLWMERYRGGAYTDDAIDLRRRFQRRWLVSDYAAGDLLIFTMFTMHASPDNLTRRFRLSSDTRYQLQSEPVDERWIGANPIAHGPGGKRGIIC